MVFQSIWPVYPCEKYSLGDLLKQRVLELEIIGLVAVFVIE